ncbi:hypothetical protein ACIA8K_29050 [Catenuloplanes sp. NPDC051500]|uniref:hypothetical protein n=1 Tax=Catenuloplanes sp. NPDC051500 TaxID=3363959 RepID=UPI00379F6885
MAAGWESDSEQIRMHARNLDALREQFAAVKGASSHITRDDQAYGLLCGWISAILEARHQPWDEVVAYLEENLQIAADGLRETADAYDAVDADTTKGLLAIEGRLR